MSDWRDPRQNPRKWGFLQHLRVTTDKILVVVMVVASGVAGWALAHLVHILLNY